MDSKQNQHRLQFAVPVGLMYDDEFGWSAGTTGATLTVPVSVVCIHAVNL